MTTHTPTVIEEARKMAWAVRPIAYSEADKAGWMSGRYDTTAPIRAFISAIELGERRAEAAVQAAIEPKGGVVAANLRFAF